MQADKRLNCSYHQTYLREFKRAFAWRENETTWGMEEAASVSWLRKRIRQVKRVLPLITLGESPADLLLGDLSAGPGHYTLPYAAYFKSVVHCDLSVDALNYAMQKANRQNINNIVFLRIDYFNPPFCESLDRIICFDTLIRGDFHERVLLKAIHRSLRTTGVALIDFHNWWHNPLRRLGLLPQTFGENRSYTRSEIGKLLRSCGIYQYQYFPFHQEVDWEATGSRLLGTILPPTRHLYRVTGNRIQEKKHL